MSETGASGADRWRRIEEIVDAALELPADGRGAYLERACGGDRQLQAAAARWLAACEGSGAFLAEPAAAFAAPLLAASPTPVRAFPGEIEAPHRAGPYRIGSRLGRGGMGAVYEAERDDGHFRQRVAVKVIHRGLHADESLVERFLAERQILAQLEHPNIARLLDGGITADGRPFFAMEYVDGMPIDQYCDERRLPLEGRLDLFVTVCLAVHAAHQQRIVHRDLKPSNILVTADGTVKLLDFGIAKLLAEDETAGLTRTGVRLLTPEYASPEQVRGDPVTPATDVYALGVLLYRLLAGRSPYGPQPARHTLERAIVEADPLSLVSVMDARTGGAATDPTADEVAVRRGTSADRLRRALRGDLNAIALTALRKQPSDRYPDAAAFADDVRRYLAGRPVAARAPGPLHRIRRQARRHRKSAVAAAVGVVATLVLLTVAGGGSLRGRVAAPAAAVGATAGLTSSEGPVLAIGSITDHRPDADSSAGPLADMLATSLGRVEGLRIVSAVRMTELTGHGPDATSYHAARRAGATELIEGALYAVGDGRLRLDLRRVELSTGAIVAAHSAVGADLFEVADSATDALARRIGLATPAGSVADATTRSLVAHRFYLEGLREHFHGSPATAERLFAAALEDDSTFAMAAYYHAIAPGLDAAEAVRRLARAERLAARVPDRERLIIRAAAARSRLSPSLRAIADTLVTRYPQALEGHLYAGLAHLIAGEPRLAIAPFRRVIESDTIGIGVGTTACAACIGYQELVAALLHSDSLESAVRVAEEGVRRYPASATVWNTAARAHMHAGRFDEALRDYDRAVALMPLSTTLPLNKAYVWLKADQAERAEALVAADTASGDGPRRQMALWMLALALRQQGRLRDALTVARRYRVVATGAARPTRADAASAHALLEAQLLFEMGRARPAAVLFDSLSRWEVAGEDPAPVASRRIWGLTQRATVLAAIGDTASLSATAAEIERLGPGSYSGRNRTLDEYVRGLLLLARGDTAAAEAELLVPFRVDGNFGYSRVNVALADLYLGRGRPGDAVTMLQATLRNEIDGSATYLSRGEAHERLALAWEAAGRRDSARAHWAALARIWSRADRELAPRLERARQRVSGS